MKKIESLKDQMNLFESPALTIKSPLSYYGSKNKGKELLDNCIPQDVDEIVAPFVGGGAFELFLTRRRIRVHGYDYFEPLTNFWQEYIKDAALVCNTARSIFFSNDYEYFKESQKGEYYNLETNIEKAAHFLILSKVAFNGIIFKCALPPNEYVVEDEKIFVKKDDVLYRRYYFSKELEHFFNPYFSVGYKDFEESLALHKDLLAYLDPPYPEARDSYGDKPEHHKAFDHQRLRDLLVNRKKWVLSYNDTDTVRALYEKFKMYKVGWKYSVSQKEVKESNEIIICSPDLEEHISRFYHQLK